MKIVAQKHPKNIDERVKIQAINYMFERMPGSNINQLAFPPLFVAALWESCNHIHLLIWLTVALSLNVIRFVFAKLYLKYGDNYKSPFWWVNIYVISSALMGLLWGYAGYTFYSTEVIGQQVVIITFVFGMSTGTIYLTAYWLKSFYAWTYPILLLMIYRFYSEGTTEYIMIAIGLLLYLAIVTKIAKYNNTIIEDTIKLRFENTELIANLKKEKERAEEANMAKSKFLASASHDLRQPLHTIGLFTSLLENKLENDTQKNLLSKVCHSLDALCELLNTLLDISKLDAGVVEKNIEHFTLEKLLNRLVSEFKEEAADKGLLFHYISTDVVVYSDTNLLELILRNILSNAIRYTKYGKVSLNVVKTDHGKIKIVIKDTGIGIPQDKQQVIFQEFNQLGNPERDRVKGLGLGLSIVNRLVDLLGYSLEMESVPNEGTVFSLIVPSGDANKAKENNTIKISDINLSLNDTIVMIIDDDKQILEGMQRALEEWGCHVIAVESEKQALDKIKSGNPRPEVLISDYRLREEKTGAQAIDAIQQEIGEIIPALIITGDTAPERLREAKASGHVLLHKPVQLAQILAFIRRSLLKNNEVA